MDENEWQAIAIAIMHSCHANSHVTWIEYQYLYTHKERMLAYRNSLHPLYKVGLVEHGE